MFLGAPEPALVSEAARAIYDRPIEAALPALAAPLAAKRSTSRRSGDALAANHRLRGADQAAAVAAIAFDIRRARRTPRGRPRGAGRLGGALGPRSPAWPLVADRAGDADLAASPLRGQEAKLLSGPAAVQRAAVKAAVALGVERRRAVAGRNRAGQRPLLGLAGRGARRLGKVASSAGRRGRAAFARRPFSARAADCAGTARRNESRVGRGGALQVAARRHHRGASGRPGDAGQDRAAGRRCRARGLADQADLRRGSAPRSSSICSRRRPDANRRRSPGSSPSSKPRGPQGMSRWPNIASRCTAATRSGARKSSSRGPTCRASVATRSATAAAKWGPT